MKSPFGVAVSTGRLGHLRRGSYFILMSSSIASAVGFLFWLTASGLYTDQEIGVAAGLISIMNLAILLSRFGIEQSMIRFLPERDKSSVLGTTILATTLGSCATGFIVTVAAISLSNDLEFLRTPMNFALLMVVVMAGSIVSVTGNAFIGLRRSEHLLTQSLIGGSRILLLLPFTAFGAIGIFSAIGLSLGLASAFSLLVLVWTGVGLGRIDTQFLRDSVGFSAGNYAVGLLTTAPVQLLPIMILNMEGSEAAAQYFVTYAIVSVLFLVPGAVSTSLFVEGSHGERIEENVRKSFSTAMVLLAVCLIPLYVFGGYLLQLLGPLYLQGYALLKVMAPSSVLVTIVSIYFSVKKAQKKIGVVVRISILFFVMMIVLGYLFVSTYGTIGAGYTWIVTYGTLAGIVICLVAHQGFD